jgi:hypothetical protein
MNAPSTFAYPFRSARPRRGAGRPTGRGRSIVAEATTRPTSTESFGNAGYPIRIIPKDVPPARVDRRFVVGARVDVAGRLTALAPCAGRP